MIRFLAGVVVGAIALAAAYLWLVFRPIRIELTPQCDHMDGWRADCPMYAA